MIEKGYTCPTANALCLEICGDGYDFGHYECEDGNTVAGDGCSSKCKIESGYACTGGTPTMKDTCTTVCGTGFKTPNEGCDDNNLVDGDG